MDVSTVKIEEKFIEMWEGLINSLISNAEYASTITCATCGKKFYHDHIVLNGWIYDSCRHCLINDKERFMGRDISSEIEKSEKIKKLVNLLEDSISMLKENEIAKVEELVVSFKK